MDKVSVFESSDFGELRIIVDPKGDVWFVASDVAKSLGYINAKDAARAWADQYEAGGRSRRSDGTYMGYGGGIYDHYGMHEKMKEMEERENELEERERRLEERERRHEMEDREYRRMGYESYPTDYYGDDRYYGDGPQMRRGRGRGRGRSY